MFETATIYSVIDQDKLLVQIPSMNEVWAEHYIRKTLGSRVKLQTVTDNNGVVWWEVNKSHLDTLTYGLQDSFKGVWVVRDYSTKQVCTTHCQKAEGDDCICSCGGEFHRGGGDWSKVIGDLLIGHDVRRVTRYFAKDAA